MLSYFKYYIIKTQQARNSIVLKLCGYAAAFMPDVWGCVVPQVGGVTVCCIIHLQKSLDEDIRDVRFVWINHAKCSVLNGL